tara:strand:- start:4 stop:306 length:303 start_codon:yes stop_codon:yes gene_type:complete
MTDHEKDLQLAEQIEVETSLKRSELQQLMLSLSIDKLSEFQNQIKDSENLHQFEKDAKIKEIKETFLQFLVKDSSLVKSIDAPYNEIIETELINIARHLF